MKTTDKIAALIILILCSIATLLFVYVLIPHLSIHFSSGRTTAKVIEWKQKDDDLYMVYVYTQQGKKYTIEKEVERPKVKEFQTKSEVTVIYSKLFPGNSLIEGIRDTSDIFLILALMIAGFGLYRSIQVLRKKISVSEFVHYR